MPNRSVRQCRERWNNNLSSNILKDKWSSKEDELLKQKYFEFGPKWKLLEKFFPGRTSYNIRNRWSCIVRLWNIYSNQPVQNCQMITQNKNTNTNKKDNKDKNKNKQIQNLIINQQETNNIEYPSFHFNEMNDIQDFSSEYDQFEETIEI